jgi:hypothetical protein
MATDKERQNSEEIKKNTQETAKANQTIAEQIESYSKDAAKVSTAFEGIAAEMRKTASSSKDFGAELKGATGLTTDLNRQAKELAKFTKEDLENQQITEKTLKKQKVVKGQIQAIESKIAALNELAANATAEEQKLLFQQIESLSNAAFEAETLLKNFEGIAEINKELNNKTAFFDRINEVVGDIPGIGKFFNEFQKASEAARKSNVAGISATTEGLKAVTRLGGKLVLLGAISELIKMFGRVQKQTKQLRGDLNLSSENSIKIRKEFEQIAESKAGKTAQSLVDAVTTVSDQLGIAVDTTNTDLLLAISTATKKLGLTADEAVRLSTFTNTTDMGFQQFQNRIAGTTEALNITNGTAIRFQDVIQDIAAASAATQLTTNKFAGGIENAAYQARRFGLSMAMLEGSSQNLLDFESSIASELEAELLTGRSLNLERARAAALIGDQATLAEEIRKNVGDIDQFTNQSVLAQEAQAKALGMSRDELAQMLINEKAINELGGDRSKSLNENVQARLKDIEGIEDATKREEERNKLLETVGDTQIGNQIRNQTFQEAQAEMFEKMSQSLSSMADNMTLLVTPMQGLLSVTTSVREGFEKIIARGLGMKQMLMSSSVFANKIAGAIAKIPKLFGSLFKAGGKVGGKVLLKKIPVLGALYGVYLGVKRMVNGDILGGIMEIGSGLLSTVPGLGTAGSLAMDAAIIARDTTGATGMQITGDGKKGADATIGPAESDFIREPGGKITSFNKGDLVLGGTDLMGGGAGMNQMLERQNQLLEQILNKSSDVKMNTYSVQSALVVDNFKNG